MSAWMRNTGPVPLPPRYIMLSKSEPPYNLILTQLQDSQRQMIRSSYYYIRAGYEWHCVCRIAPSRGPMMFHEILDPGYGRISDEDILEAIEQDARFSPCPDSIKSRWRLKKNCGQRA